MMDLAEMKIAYADLTMRLEALLREAESVKNKKANLLPHIEEAIKKEQEKKDG